MNPILKNILINTLAIIVGVFAGAFINGGIIIISGSIIPYPQGYDNSTPEKFKATFHLLETKHFIMPFAAHALGTFTGALIAGLIAIKHKMIIGLSIGGVFLFGGIMMILLVASPLWFTILDLGLAYIPMGYCGIKTASLIRKR